MKGSAASLVALVLAVALPAQQQDWQVFGPYDHQYTSMARFADFDNDGNRDLLVSVFPYGVPHPLSYLHDVVVLSGPTGAVLWQSVAVGFAHGFQFVRPAGDMDRDGLPDFAMRDNGGSGGSAVVVWSTGTNQEIWSVLGPYSGTFGFDLVGDLDTDGDGAPDLVTLTRSWQSEVFVYDNAGSLRYTLPCFAVGLEALSLAKMGDIDGDHCDDFLVGCSDYLTGARGIVLLVSGKNGNILRISQGLLPGDKTFFNTTNLGDIDGDGVNDYAAFPWWSASRLMPCLWSGATGALIRTLPGVYAESVVADQDLDLDGVNDLVLGWEYPISPPQLYGRSQAISGRDGTELWTVDNFQGSGQPSTGWGRFAAGLGVQPGSPYPAVAWMDLMFVDHSQMMNLAWGRVRGFHATRAGQGPVLGTPCTSDGTLPQIGVRKTASGSRITIAKSHPNGVAALWLSIQPLPAPVDLSPFGLTGCSLYVSADAAWLRTLGATGIDRGYAAIDLPFQLSASGTGLGVTAQWLVVDPATGNHAATAMHALRLQ
ncbi:MAG: VCBS repeat-containing protein [Planctomycetes bacterium]|nr:VCBS repeat-containing protein [Planctomycetota bacterium]